VDLDGMRERIGGPAFFAITSRGNHPGGVNARLGDGAVRFVKRSINGQVWRALVTVARERSSARMRPERGPGRGRVMRADRVIPAYAG
jgi:hypothetical protein